MQWTRPTLVLCPHSMLSILRHQHSREKVAHFALDFFLLGLGHLPRGRRDRPALASHHGVSRRAQMRSVMLHAVVLAGKTAGAALVRTLVVFLSCVDSHMTGEMSRGRERPATVAHVLLALFVVHVVEIHVDNWHRLGLIKRG